MTVNRAARSARTCRAVTEAATVPAPDRARLAAVDHAERTRVLDAYVRRELGRVLGIAPHRVDTTGRPMRSLGVGSIAGLELQRRMEHALQVELNLQMLLLANSAAELVECLAGQLGPHTAAARPHRTTVTA
ncbi:acyl carrier protein [Kitasatospora sp. NPDC056531]|uniref:acyl carrier protein n=1 Tax=Kitasatospora sp. NPDC056531 TaxID=3345856 RepID=UPI00368EFA1F